MQCHNLPVCAIALSEMAATEDVTVPVAHITVHAATAHIWNHIESVLHVRVKASKKKRSLNQEAHEVASGNPIAILNICLPQVSTLHKL